MKYPGDHHEVGHPIWEENFIGKNIKMQGPFFSATPVNVINKSSEMLFQIVQQIYTLYQLKKYNLFPIFLFLTNQETLYNLNIELSIKPPFEPITAFFTITCLCPAAIWLIVSDTMARLTFYAGVLHEFFRRCLTGEMRVEVFSLALGSDIAPVRHQ